MKLRTSLACSALALCVGLSLAPVARAMDNDGAMKGDAMMHKGSMKKHKKHKTMMMHGDSMKKDDAAPQ